MRSVGRLDVDSGNVFPGTGLVLKHDYKAELTCEYID